MPKVITGTKARKEVQVLKGQMDIRQIACPRCKSGNTAGVPNGVGGVKQRCKTCGAEFHSIALP